MTEETEREKLTKNKKTVLFCGPVDHAVNSGRYIINAMEQLGYEVIGYDYRSHDNIEEDLSGIIRQRKPDYVFTLKGEKIPPELIREFRASGAITILWYVDYPLYDWTIALAAANDFVVTNMEGYIDYLNKRDVTNVKWVPQGFAPDFFGINGPGVENDGIYYADVAMIGSMGKPLYKTRSGLIMKLRRDKIDIKWWGPHLSRQIKNIPYFLGGVHMAWAGKSVFMKDFADVVRHTRIYLGQDADIPVEGRYLSNRGFAVMGCGGFYLSRRTSGIESAFDVGREMDVFDNDDELIEKVHFYLKNEAARKQIALAGQKRVLSGYTYKQQLEKIFTWVNESSG